MRTPDRSWPGCSSLLSVPTLEPAAHRCAASPGRGMAGRPTCRSVATRATSLQVCRGRRTWRASQIRGAALVWDLQQRGRAPPLPVHRQGRPAGRARRAWRGPLHVPAPDPTLGGHRRLTRARPATTGSGPSQCSPTVTSSVSTATPRPGSTGPAGGSSPRYPSDGSFLMSLRVRPDGRRFIVISSDEREVREWKVVDAGGASRNLLPRPRQRQRRRLLRRRDVRLCVRAGWHRPAPLGPHRGEGLRVDRADVLRLGRPVRGDGRRRPALRGAGRRRMGPGPTTARARSA